MTDEQYPNPGESHGDSVIGDADESSLDPKTEAFIVDSLASLPELKMPTDVHERLLAALAAEPNPYAKAASTFDPMVSALPTQRNRRNGWLVGIAGVAAVSVLGLVIGASVLDGETGTTVPITAATIPMNTTNNQYQKETFTTQVAAALPTWRSAATQSTRTPEPTSSRSASASASPPVVSSSPSPSTPTSPLVGPVDQNLREQVVACLAKLNERAPMHVEIASYRATPSTPIEEVAVAAVDGANDSVDVYAIKVTCVTGDPQLVREHITLNTK